MIALVTGGAGFIGSNLARALAARGARVRVLDDLSTGCTANLDGAEVDLTIGSLCDLVNTRRVMEGVDVVFHQAALPSIPRSVADPLSTHEATATGTLNVLVAAQQANVRRVVYASSSSVYGQSHELPRTEQQITTPTSPYAVAKLAGENYCRAFTVTHGLETVALRYFNVYGPRQSPTGGYAAVIPRFVSAALAGESPIVTGDGRQTRDFTYVDDVVAANLAAAEAGSAAAGRVMNIATGERHTLLGLLEIVGNALGGMLQPTHVPARVGDTRHSLADVSLAAKLLGYQPRTDLKKGLSATIKWIQNSGWGSSLAARPGQQQAGRSCGE